MKALYVLLLIPTLAFGADEAQIGCELVKAQAEVQATELAYPSAVAMAGQPTDISTTIAVGVTQSLSGIVRAKDLRKSASAKCDALYAETDLDLYEKWAVLMAQRKGDIAEQNALDESISIQKDYISNLTAQLNEHLVTEAIVKAAGSAIVSTEQRQGELAKSLAMEIIPAPDGDLGHLIKEANSKEGLSATLSAKSQADSGWDFQVTTGFRRLINGDGAVSGFVTASVKYSFGTSAAQKAARIVGEKTTELLNIQNAGYNQTVQRNRIELLRLIEVEHKLMMALNHEVMRIQALRSPLIGIDSTLAKNAITEADIQISILSATLAGSVARQSAYQVLLTRFEGIS